MTPPVMGDLAVLLSVRLIRMGFSSSGTTDTGRARGQVSR
jgi:hypothetical protein